MHEIYVYFWFEIVGPSANARPVGKNHPLEKILCEPFAGFSSAGVQWQSLDQGLPSFCSRKFLWQVSMLFDYTHLPLNNISLCKNGAVKVCQPEDVNELPVCPFFCLAYRIFSPVLFCSGCRYMKWRHFSWIHTYFRMRFRGSRTSIHRVEIWPLHIGLWLTYAFYSNWIEEVR